MKRDRMLNLQPLVARFVDEVLRAIGSASLEDLRELSPALVRSERDKSPPRAVPRAPRRSARPTAKPKLEPPRREPPATAVHEARNPEPELPGDITDPTALLVLGMDSRAEPQRSRHDSALLEHPAKKPAARTPPPKANLRAGETVARAGASGLIIRRAKRPA